MKYFALTATLALAACAGNQDAQPKAAAPEVGMANPASVFCEKQGGKSEIRKNADGSEYGVCRLPNGKVVEEWEYFRANNK